MRSASSPRGDEREVGCPRKGAFPARHLCPRHLQHCTFSLKWTLALTLWIGPTNFPRSFSRFPLTGLSWRGPKSFDPPLVPLPAAPVQGAMGQAAGSPACQGPRGPRIDDPSRVSISLVLLARLQVIPSLQVIPTWSTPYQRPLTYLGSDLRERLRLVTIGDSLTLTRRADLRIGVLGSPRVTKRLLLSAVRHT
jgi:hypothetical protein